MDQGTFTMRAAAVVLPPPAALPVSSSGSKVTVKLGRPVMATPCAPSPLGLGHSGAMSLTMRVTWSMTSSGLPPTMP